MVNSRIDDLSLQCMNLATPLYFCGWWARPYTRHERSGAGRCGRRANAYWREHANASSWQHRDEASPVTHDCQMHRFTGEVNWVELSFAEDAVPKLVQKPTRRRPAQPW
jgi:hypothetical protein